MNSTPDVLNKPPVMEAPVDEVSNNDCCRILAVALGAIALLVGLFAILHGQDVLTCGLGSIGTGGGVGLLIGGLVIAGSAIFIHCDEEKKDPQAHEAIFETYQNLSFGCKDYARIEIVYSLRDLGRQPTLHFQKNEFTSAELLKKLGPMKSKDITSYNVWLYNSKGTRVAGEAGP